ncbi:endonuclease domain-containing 1 protein-like [Tachysurus vachellii]|uniref:endonuclease domain-containing 1 protein-like n=1 Tax=Tachysurus vachellii TaxID=175792 RepID=UPI00296ADE1A|nr:endonuclease domain-containing 1 protein-like [Tachysurus vachellii]
MKLLALVLLLSTFSSLTLMEVVQDFQNSSCSKFFIRSPNVKHVITPTVFKGYQYKQICQRLNNKYTFVTLYDTIRRIPVYSAYTFLGEKQTVRNKVWKNEPQLEDMRNSIEMRKISNDEMDGFVHQAPHTPPPCVRMKLLALVRLLSSRL